MMFIKLSKLIANGWHHPRFQNCSLRLCRVLCLNHIAHLQNLGQIKHMSKLKVTFCPRRFTGRNWCCDCKLVTRNLAVLLNFNRSTLTAQGAVKIIKYTASNLHHRLVYPNVSEHTPRSPALLRPLYRWLQMTRLPTSVP